MTSVRLPKRASTIIQTMYFSHEESFASNAPHGCFNVEIDLSLMPFRPSFSVPFCNCKRAERE